MVALAAFPYNVYVTFMLQRNKVLLRNRSNYKNKLMFAGLLQFACIIGIIQAGKRFEKIERKCVEKYLASVPLDEIK